MKKRGKMPKYEVIYNQLLREISSTCKVGDLFQTQRDLMARFNASYATIGHVLKKLKEQEIIATHIGKGIFIKNIPSQKILKSVKIAVFIRNYSGPEDKSISGLYQSGLLEAQEKLPCELVFLNRTDNEKEMLQQFKKTSSDGILFLEDGMIKLINLVKQEGIPYVVVHPIHQKHSFCVDIDDASGIKTAIQQMVENGAKKILFAGHAISYGHNYEKLEAYRMALKLLGLPFDEKRLITINKEDDLITKIDKLRTHLRDKNNYDGILLIDPVYLEIMEGALRYENVSIPDNAQFAIFGDYGYVEKCKFPLGVIHVPYKDAAIQGMEILVKQCHGSKSESDIQLLKTSFSWKK